MEYNLNEPIAERKTKTVYRDGNKTIKLFIENYSKALILENSEDEIYDGLYKLLNDNDDKIFNNTQTNTEYDNTEKLQKIIELVGD